MLTLEAMCGRFSSTLSAEFIRRLFGTDGDICRTSARRGTWRRLRTLWWSVIILGNAAELLRPAADGTLRAWPVSPQVNSPRNNDDRLIGAVDRGGRKAEDRTRLKEDFSSDPEATTARRLRH